MQTRLLSESDKEATRHVVESTINKAVGRNFLLRPCSLGKFINIACLLQSQYRIVAKPFLFVHQYVPRYTTK